MKDVAKANYFNRDAKLKFAGNSLDIGAGTNV